MSATDALVAAIGDGVIEYIKPLIERRRVMSEEEVMKMLGIENKRNMSEYRKKGLKGHKLDYRHWVYFVDDVEEFVQGCNEW